MKTLTAIAAFVALSLASAESCVAKEGYIGGQFKLAPGLTPVCGAQKAKFLEGVKASYRERGKTPPNFIWFEAYVIDKDSPHRAKLITNTMNGFKAAGYTTTGAHEQAKTLETFGYFSRGWRPGKGPGQWITQMNITEPRGTAIWQKMYYLFMATK